ncbi:MAG TPA: hypothetical protein VHV49_02060 [Pseudonocardiaceae bacterium]|nr:hypothetical protein [Pseudonocardiaceae bacterium]
METAVWWVFLVVVWIATLNVFSVQEVIVAAAAAVPCAVAARAARRAAGLRWAVRAGWSRWLLTLPSAVAHDTVAALRLAVAPRSTREADDEFRTVDLPGGHDDARWAGRAATTITVLSSTPGSVVIDSDDERGELLTHSLPIGDTRLEQQVRQ